MYSIYSGVSYPLVLKTYSVFYFVMISLFVIFIVMFAALPTFPRSRNWRAKRCAKQTSWPAYSPLSVQQRESWMSWRASHRRLDDTRAATTQLLSTTVSVGRTIAIVHNANSNGAHARIHARARSYAARSRTMAACRVWLEHETKIHIGNCARSLIPTPEFVVRCPLLQLLHDRRYAFYTMFVYLVYDVRT